MLLQITRASEKFARIFQFDWEEDDDTSKNDKNPLYNERQHINPLFGRGYIAGVDLRYVCLFHANLRQICELYFFLHCTSYIYHSFYLM